MKASLLIPVLALCAQVASADILFNDSNIQTGTGNGFNGANTSSIGTGSTTFGFNQNASTSFQLADNFTLGSNSLVSSVVFFGYSTSNYPSPPTSPFTGATLSIWNAQPGSPGAAVLFTSNTLAVTSWTGIYRVQTTTLTNAQRPVMSLQMSFANVALNAGTYWASWTVTGVGAPGNAASIFGPQRTNADGSQPVGDSLQSADGGVTWNPTLDNTGAGPQVAMPLIVNGTAVPEPSTTAMLISGLGLAVAALRHRRTRSSR